MARVSSDVWATSGSRPSLGEQAPGLAGLLFARLERSTSHQPVKRFSRFQALWPWRTSTSVDMGPSLPGLPVTSQDR